ncbi:mechanosensitive ion channel family protein [Paenisporosarcina sp. TG20]|uniref:mechanosensitive ion channel family protein n=1 Tax=Paenisporosarcina sp. TG20 TaxID=1211706 RepID=UPI00031832F8|nr:mechanosensitive ion channel domain-containing protein [Paenisporosarcina sp. TG20]
MNELVDTIMSNTTIYKFLIALLGVVIITFFITGLKKTAQRYVKDHSNWYKTKKTMNIFGYILIVIFLAILYSDMLGGITVVLGVASAGIAFSLKEVIASIAGWLTILMGGMFKTGDRVQLGGVTGDVIDLGVLRTTVMEVGQWVDGDLYNGRIVKIANSFVFTQPVYNYSTDFPFLWDELTIPVKFGSEYTLARELIYKVADEKTGEYNEFAREYWELMMRKFVIEDATTKPLVTLAVNDNWVEFTLRYVVEYKRRRIMKDELFTGILEEIERSSGRVKLASATFEVVSTPPFDVNITHSRDQR